MKEVLFWSTFPLHLPSPPTCWRGDCELTGEERGVLVEFLLHLDEFDRRRAWAEAGYDSLWNYCLRVLHLREGPAGRRIAAMRVLRRFPALETALRDGRLCLSTVTLIAPLLTEENLQDVVALAGYRTKAEVERLVAAVQPRTAPKDGVRRLPDRAARVTAADASSETTATALLQNGQQTTLPAEAALSGIGSHAPSLPSLAAAIAELSTSLVASAATRADTVPAITRPTVTAVSADTFSLRVTLDAALKADLDELTALLSHNVANGDLAAILREAIRCAIEKHGTRKGAKAPAQKRARTAAIPRAAIAPAGRPHIPAEVRREVWRRDGGRCTWTGPDGHRCGSRWQLELDHVVPVALGGESTADGLRLLCRTHNQLHAEQVFGGDHMARFRRRATRTGKVAHPGMSKPGGGARGGASWPSSGPTTALLFPADAVPGP